MRKVLWLSLPSLPSASLFLPLLHRLMLETVVVRHGGGHHGGYHRGHRANKVVIAKRGHGHGIVESTTAIAERVALQNKRLSPGAFFVGRYQG